VIFKSQEKQGDGYEGHRDGFVPLSIPASLLGVLASVMTGLKYRHYYHEVAS
jgi:hypothetical protein